MKQPIPRSRTLNASLLDDSQEKSFKLTSQFRSLRLGCGYCGVVGYSCCGTLSDWTAFSGWHGAIDELEVSRGRHDAPVGDIPFPTAGF